MTRMIDRAMMLATLIRHMTMMTSKMSFKLIYGICIFSIICRSLNSSTPCFILQ